MCLRNSLREWKKNMEIKCCKRKGRKGLTRKRKDSEAKEGSGGITRGKDK